MIAGEFPIAMEVRLDPPEYGYKVYRTDRIDTNSVIVLKPLEEKGPIGWWHEFHGVKKPDPEGGRGVRIGVIDDYIDPEFAEEHGITILDAAAIGVEPSLEGTAYRSDHASKVLSLLCAKPSTGDGYVGMAPGAEIFFISGRNWREDEDEEIQLDDAVVANAIEYLAKAQGCDLITVSAGGKDPLPEVLDAIEKAQKSGAVCFFGSGNDGEPLYPALYESCLGVAAIGKYGSAANDEGGWYDEAYLAFEMDDAYYCWSGSGLGEGIDILAAGANVVFTVGGAPAGKVTGTSYACPIATGVAALVLAREHSQWMHLKGEERWNKVVDVLLANCDSVGVPEFEMEMGIIRTAR